MPALQKKSERRLSAFFGGSNSSSQRLPPSISTPDLRAGLAPEGNMPWAPTAPNSRASSGAMARPTSSRASEASGIQSWHPSASLLHPDFNYAPLPRRPLPERLDTDQHTDLPGTTNFSRPRSGTQNSGHSATFGPGIRSGSGPTTPVDGVGRHALAAPVMPTSATKLKRRSWFGSSKAVKEEAVQKPGAWIVGHQAKMPYDVSPLLAADRLPELWDPNGDTLVYLFPRPSGRGPSFRIQSGVYASSAFLTRLAHGGIYSNETLADRDRPTPTFEGHGSSGGSNESQDSRNLGDSQELSRDTHMYLPINLSTNNPSNFTGAPIPFSPEDIDILVTVRNLFAFLVGQSLIATERRPTVFSIFMKISELLKGYEFSNMNGSSFGEVANMSFDGYVEELRIADVRASREKTIEGIVLGERMRSVLLYNEAFVHGVGKYEEITKLGNKKFELISGVTLNRMERASMDLYLRQKSTDAKLANFEFPSIFAGIMNSKTAEESKLVRFESWRTSFMALRRDVMGHYKAKYGSWPPKASSKKNNLETSGLNRLVLKDLYHDFANLYDLLVDRDCLTTRTADGHISDMETSQEPVIRALRSVLSEYDRATPPVQPPIPFDVPLLPNLATTRKDYGTGDAKKDAKARGKKLKTDEIVALLRSAHNPDANISVPFLEMFAELERKSVHGKTLTEICDIRAGHWLFMYAVLQSLPMLVIDAPAVKWTHGVESYLCSPPRSGVPWAREDHAVQRNWYEISGGGGVVSLPSDVIEFGVEGTYRRSHCWEMAQRWTADNPLLNAAAAETLDLQTAPLPMPPVFGGSGTLLPNSRPGSRDSSPGRRSNRQSVVGMGLEALPLPHGVQPESPRMRAVADVDPLKTFDAIIGRPQSPTKGKKK